MMAKLDIAAVQKKVNGRTFLRFHKLTSSLLSVAILAIVTVAPSGDGKDVINQLPQATDKEEKDLLALKKKLSDLPTGPKQGNSAEKLCREGLAISETRNWKETTLQPSSWRYALVLAILKSEKHQEKLAECETLAKQQINDAKQGELPISKHALACFYEQLGWVYVEQEKFDQAEPVIKESIDMFQKLYSKDASLLDTNLSNLTVAYEGSGKWADAEASCQRLVELKAKAKPPEAPLYVASGLYKLGNILQHEGKKEAAEVYERAFKLYNPFAKKKRSESNPQDAVETLIPAPLIYALMQQLPPETRALITCLKPMKVANPMEILIVDLRPVVWDLREPENPDEKDKLERITNINQIHKDVVLIFSDMVRECLLKVDKQQALSTVPWTKRFFDKRNHVMDKALAMEFLPHDLLPGTSISGRFLCPRTLVIVYRSQWDKLKTLAKVRPMELQRLWDSCNEIMPFPIRKDQVQRQ